MGRRGRKLPKDKYIHKWKSTSMARSELIHCMKHPKLTAKPSNLNFTKTNLLADIGIELFN